MILEDFIESVNVYDLEGKVYFSLCVYQHALMDRALGASIFLITVLFNLGSYCHANRDKIKGQKYLISPRDYK